MPRKTPDAKKLTEAINSDPAQAVEFGIRLVENCCNTILEHHDRLPERMLDLAPLVQRTVKVMGISPIGVHGRTKEAKTLKKMLDSVARTCQSLAELQKLYGTGGRRDAKKKGFLPGHAKLAVASATGISAFLLDAHMNERA